MDNLTKEQRSKNMRAIKSKDTSIELKLRKTLWEMGIRYRKNYSKLPGKPDIAITKFKIAIFCDSEFWHGYKWETNKEKIKSNHEYWIPKIEGNISRDNKNNQLLKIEGWLVIRLWEKDIRKAMPDCIDKILKAVNQRKNQKY